MPKRGAGQQGGPPPKRHKVGRPPGTNAMHHQARASVAKGTQATILQFVVKDNASVTINITPSAAAAAAAPEAQGDPPEAAVADVPEDIERPTRERLYTWDLKKKNKKKKAGRVRHRLGSIGACIVYFCLLSLSRSNCLQCALLLISSPPPSYPVHRLEALEAYHNKVEELRLLDGSNAEDTALNAVYEGVVKPNCPTVRKHHFKRWVANEFKEVRM